MNNQNIVFKYTDMFLKQWHDLHLTKQDLTDFETGIVEFRRNPPENNKGNVFPGDRIVGTGGACKYRYRLDRSTEGKSGSYRTIYFIATENTLYFFEIYKKGKKDSLSNQEKNALKRFSEVLRRSSSND